MRKVILPANIIITGATKSGKTYLTTKLIREQLKKQLDYLIIFSPTIKLSGDFEEFKETSNNDDKNGLIVKKYHKNFSNHINEIIKNQEELFNLHKKEMIPNIMFVLDDMVNDPTLKYRGIIDILSTKSRHLNISIMVLVQRLSAVPKTFRLNAKYVFFFSSVNFKELETILEQYSSKKYAKTIKSIIEDIFNKPYSFIMAENFNPIMKERLWLNGKKKIIE